LSTFAELPVRMKPSRSRATVSSCAVRRRRRLREAQRVPRLLRQRSARPGRRRPGCHAAAGDDCGAERAVGSPGLKDDPVVGARGAGRPRHPAGRPARHGRNAGAKIRAPISTPPRIRPPAATRQTFSPTLARACPARTTPPPLPRGFARARGNARRARDGPPPTLSANAAARRPLRRERDSPSLSLRRGAASRRRRGR
jgi:hypothetical protein